MKIFLKIIVPLIIVLVAGLSILYFSQPHATKMVYKNYQETVTGDPHKDHWIPDIMPKSATDIFVRYDVDANYQRLQFSYSSIEDEESILSNFEKLDDPGEIKSVLEVLGRMSWNTQITKEANIYIPVGLKVKHSDWKVYLAIDKTTHMIWYSVD